MQFSVFLAATVSPIPLNLKGLGPRSGTVVRQRDLTSPSDCVVSDRRLAYAVLIRHKTLLDGEVKVCLLSVCFVPLSYKNVGLSVQFSSVP